MTEINIALATPNLISFVLRTATMKQEAISNGGFLTKGSRNNDLASMAGFLRRKGGNENEIYDYISAINSKSPDPLPDYEVRAIANSIGKYKITPEDLTHHTFAKLLVEEFKGNVLYLSGEGFYTYTGKHWVEDIESLRITDMALSLSDRLVADIENMREHLDAKEFQRLRSAINKTKSASFIRNSIDLVKANPSIHKEYGIFENNRGLLNFQNGTFDLNSMEFRRFNREDYLNNILDYKYDPQADCSLFKKFLSETFEHEVLQFILRIFGYSLLGTAIEQLFFIFHGRGRNGKSVLVDVLGHVLADYCVTVQPESLNGKLDGSIRNDLVRLRGARIMFTSETRAGTILDAALVKQITGRDNITARKLYKEHVEFKNLCVPFLVTNHLPVIDGGDFAMARRMCLIFFDKIVEFPDKTLTEKLYRERAGIFNLLIEGLLDYKKDGLAVPACIHEQTKRYLDRSNLMKNFFSDCLEVVEGQNIPAAHLYMIYKNWASSRGYKPLSINLFKEAFSHEMCQSWRRSSDGNFWVNLKFKK